jgi:hypothetical protein
MTKTYEYVLVEEVECSLPTDPVYQGQDYYEFSLYLPVLQYMEEDHHEWFPLHLHEAKT